LQKVFKGKYGKWGRREAGRNKQEKQRKAKSNIFTLRQKSSIFTHLFLSLPARSVASSQSAAFKTFVHVYRGSAGGSQASQHQDRNQAMPIKPLLP
jgi:hypothetical protein